MRSKQNIVDIVSYSLEQIKEEFDEYRAKRAKDITNLSVEEKVNDIVGHIKNLLIITEYKRITYNDESFTLPRFYCNVETFDEDFVTISFKSVINVRPKYRKEKRFLIDADILKKLTDEMLKVLSELFYTEFAKANLKDLNTDIKHICESIHLPFTFGFDLEPYEDAMVLSINDNEVIFNILEREAYNLMALPMYLSGSEFYQVVAQEAINKLKIELQSCQTTVQLIKGKIELIERLTGVVTRARASKILRQTYHRQVKNFNIVKQACTGYFNEEVEIDGSPVEIFALVHKDKDRDNEKGQMRVVLQPFDVRTNFIVDYDVLANLK